MGRKKRRSSKYRDSSTVIDMEQAREERRKRQQERQEKQKKKAKKRPSRSEAAGNAAAAARSAESAAEHAAHWSAESISHAAGKIPEGAAAAVRDIAGMFTMGEEQESQESVSSGGRVRQDRRKMALRRRKRNRNLIILGVLAGLMIIMGISLGNILMLKHDLHTAQKQQEEYKEEKAQLEKDLKQIDDLENLEEQARDQMRLVMPGETLYIFPENMTNQPETEESDETEETEEQ